MRTKARVIAESVPPSRNEAEALSRFVCDSVTEYAIFTLALDRTITTWNPGAVRAFGYAPGDVIGADVGIIFTAEDLAAGAPDAELRGALETGRADCDRWHVRKDGTRFWGTNSVQPLADRMRRVCGFTKIVRDSTERYEAAEALRQSEERFRLLVESVDHYALLTLSPEGLITLWNAGAERIFGHSHAEIVGRPFAQLFTPEDVAGGVPASELLRAAEFGQLETERRHLRGDGGRFIGRRRVTLLKPDALGAPRGYSVVVHDVTQERANEQTMWTQAFHDELTGLPNRALFVEHLQRAIAHAKRHAGAQFAVLFLDLDQFKAVNDGVGHMLADRLLAQVATRLLTCVRPEDVVARIGGDEFAVLVGSIGSAKEVVGLTDRIHAAMAEPIAIHEHRLRMSTSIGVALGSEIYDTSDEVLRDADIAMYQAKSRGRSNTVVFDDRMRESLSSRHSLERQLRRAIDCEEFFLEYQPIAAMADMRVTGFEALVRWNHPERGTLHPADFIPMAEQTGLIVPIDLWVLRTACAQLAAWQALVPGGEPLSMSVNFSAKHFSNEGVCANVKNALAASRIAPHSLKLEITEGAINDKSEVVALLLSELQTLRVDIHIDDFGTGYSSLSTLRMLPVNAVKINRAFISGMHANRERAALVCTIVTLAHNLRLAVVAEGVERLDEMEALRAFGCEFVQGFLLAPPLAVARAGALVAGGVRTELFSGIGSGSKRAATVQ